jgi:ABC-type multidrug transport system permease subunit
MDLDVYQEDPYYKRLIHILQGISYISTLSYALVFKCTIKYQTEIVIVGVGYVFMVSFFSKLQVPKIAFIRAFWVFLLYPPYKLVHIALLLPL